MAEMVYYVGSSKQASDYVTVTHFLINYIRRTYTKGEDVAVALETFKEVDFEPDRPKMKISTSDDATLAIRENKQFEKEFEVQYTAFNTRMDQYKDNKISAEALLWNQCTNTMKSKIMSRKDYESHVKGNPIKLLEAIKEHAHNYESTQYQMKTIFESLKSLVNLRQKEDESCIDYLKRFKAAKDVFLSHVGKEFCFPRLVDADPDYQTALLKATDPSTSEEDKDLACKEMGEIRRSTMDPFFAYSYLSNACSARFGSIKTGLDTQYSLNHDQYPKTLIDAQNVIENHQYDPEYKKKKKQREENRQQQKKQKEKEEEAPTLSFAQLRGNICYCCGKAHKLPDCPVRHSTPKDQWHINKTSEAKAYNNMVSSIRQTMTSDSQSVASTNTATGSVARTTAPSEGSWQFTQLYDLSNIANSMDKMLILDSGSSVDMFCNTKLLENVRERNPLNLSTNGGNFTATMEGTCPRYGDVPVNTDAVTNIMALGSLSDKYRVTYDNKVDDAFYVHTPEKTVRFGRNEANLYVHTPTTLSGTATDSKSNEPTDKPAPIFFGSFVQTVEENMRFYTPREIARAKAARELLSILGSPST